MKKYTGLCGSKNKCYDCEFKSTGIKYRLLTPTEGSYLYYWCAFHLDMHEAREGWKIIPYNTHICKLVCDCNPREAMLL